MKVVIVGGVAGGATAAARIRRRDEQADITVFEKSGFISYANCGLPYYIGGVISDKQHLTLQTPENFYRRFQVKIKIHHEVTAIFTHTKTVLVKNLETGVEFEESYDKLLLSPGAKPVKLPFKGSNSEKLFTLRTVEDTLKMKEYIHKNQPKSVIIVGGGFIGLEMAENLRELGMNVTIVESLPQLMAPFDSDMAAFIHARVRKKGVKLLLGHLVEDVYEKKDSMEVLLQNAMALQADMVILAIGVVPDTAFVKNAGLKLGIKDSIIVNQRMETSIPDIYAVGDAVQVKHFVTGADALISLAGPANKQGRIAADNICGVDHKFSGSQASTVIKVFDLTAASTGINERIAKDLEIDCDKVILSPMSHAEYYPGGKIMMMKVLFEKETYRLLGAQMIGFEGVDKRIDVLATAIRAGMKSYQLAEIDLAYAPPYSSAKDPVNMVGFMIENIKNGVVKQWYYEDVYKLPGDGSVILLDTRTSDEYNYRHIKGFINIPLDELRERLGELDKMKSVYVICQSGLRSYIASCILMGNGFDVYNFAGGFRFYDTVKNDSFLIEQSTPCGMDN